MVRLLAIAALLAASTAHAQPPQPPPPKSTPVSVLMRSAPVVTLSNGAITMKVATLHPQKGFYRGTRFDQAGVVTSLRLSGREFYGPWFPRTAPEVLDYTYTRDGLVAGPDSAISGPVEEFTTLGFEAKPSLFVKIGVGVLRQPDTQAYDKYRHYEIVDYGVRTFTATKTSATFVQKLSGAGYSYDYEKTLRLVPGAPQLIIEHTLRNTGATPIVTTVYDHNFLRLAPGNDGVRVDFPFAISAGPTPPPADMIRIDGKSMTYLRPMAYQERLSFPITGFGATAADYDINIVDTKRGGGVRIVGDQPMARINIFSIDTVQSVEPFIAIDLAPGAEKSWRYTYTYAAR